MSGLKNSYLIFILSSLLVTMGQFHISAQDITIPLEGHGWEITNPYDPVKFKGNVPGNIFTDLMAADIIPDPFKGDNEYYVQWVSDRVWIYEKEVTVELSIFKEMEVQELVLNGVEGYATVYWNDERIGHCDNSFRPFHFNIRNNIRPVNKLRIIFENTGLVEREKEKLSYPLPGGSRVFTRKPAFHYGWDWGPRLNGVGIGGAKLKAWSGLKIESSTPVVDSVSNDMLFGTGVFHLRSAVSGLLHLNVMLDGRKVVSGFAIKVLPGEQELRVPFHVKSPRLWWTWDLGTPYRYDVQVELEYLSDEPTIQLYKGNYKTKWGLRKLGHVTDADSTGNSFYFKLNGVPVFARGANYIPQDMFQHRVGLADHDSLIQQVVRSNMNCLRVWGGGIYENDHFYTLCDSLGVMVWQDFMFACGMYPGDKEFLKNVREEAIYQVKRISAHPSLALWCGNNENAEGWARWGWQQDYSAEQRIEIERDYQRLFHEVLSEIVEAYSGNIAYWPSSPQWGRGDDRFDKEGDAHDWGVWHDEMPFDRFEKRVPRFMSEYGFQSWPSHPVTAEFSRNDGDKSIATHQKHPRGFQIMDTYRSRDFDDPQNFLDTLYISQLVQARGMVTGAEAHRLARPYCMGSLFWQLNDCWPAISWSGIDHKGYWKAMQAYIRKAYEPVMYTLRSRGDTLDLWGVNDTRKSGMDTVRLVWWLNGDIKLSSRTIPVALPAGDAALIKSFPGLGLEKDIDSTRIMVTLERNGEKDPRVYLVVRPKNYNGVHAPLEWTFESEADQHWLTLYSNAIHTSIYLPPEILFDQRENFPTILPGKALRIRVKDRPDYMRSFPFNVIRRSGFGDP